MSVQLSESMHSLHAEARNRVCRKAWQTKWQPSRHHVLLQRLTPRQLPSSHVPLKHWRRCNFLLAQARSEALKMAPLEPHWSNCKLEASLCAVSLRYLLFWTLVCASVGLRLLLRCGSRCGA